MWPTHYVSQTTDQNVASAGWFRLYREITKRIGNSDDDWGRARRTSESWRIDRTPHRSVVCLPDGFSFIFFHCCWHQRTQILATPSLNLFGIFGGFWKIWDLGFVTFDFDTLMEISNISPRVAPLECRYPNRGTIPREVPWERCNGTSDTDKG